jgi:mono/diheme cytochrome c family protein
MRRILIAAGLALAAAPVFAEETGQQAYMVACAVCHGESAMGDGPFAPLLNIQTPNLTTLAKANDGADQRRRTGRSRFHHHPGQGR